MSTASSPSEPSRDDLLAEVAALRRRVEALQQANQDLEVMLAMATEHADDLSDALAGVSGDRGSQRGEPLLSQGF
jgi:tryptophan 2,3-dioxygenase